MMWPFFPHKVQVLRSPSKANFGGLEASLSFEVDWDGGVFDLFPLALFFLAIVFSSDPAVNTTDDWVEDLLLYVDEEVVGGIHLDAIS